MAVGLYLRHLDEQRQWAVTAACREQRVRLAGEVHDRVGHEITGIVLEAQATRLGAKRQPAPSAKPHPPPHPRPALNSRAQLPGPETPEGAARTPTSRSDLP
ncbi:histidine kinase [Amycolatopsis bartoniae]